jgi:hypothetical protein
VSSAIAGAVPTSPKATTAIESAPKPLDFTSFSLICPVF